MNRSVVVGRTDYFIVTYISLEGLTLQIFIERIRRILNLDANGIPYLPQTPGRPNLDLEILPSSQADVENLLFMGFGHCPTLRFVRFTYYPISQT
jgi:hypothetical protein